MRGAIKERWEEQSKRDGKEGVIVTTQYGAPFMKKC
jgi:hypothetical protein